MNIIKSSLKNSHIITVISILILILGAEALLTMPRRATPKITVYKGLVVAFYPGATTLQVENQLTRKLERQLFTYGEINQEKTTSKTKDGYVVITVALHEWVKDTEGFWSKLRLSLSQFKKRKLPESVIGPVVDSDFGDTVALLIAIESDKRSYSELKAYLEKVGDALRTVKGTGRINISGFQEEQISVSADSQALSKYGLSLAQLMTVLKTQNAVSFSGNIDTELSSLPIHASGLYNSVEQVKNQQIFVSPQGNFLRVRDVAKVERKMKDPKSKIRINGKESNTLILSLQMQPGYNIVTFGQRIQTKLAECIERFPSDIHFTTINNQPEVVSESIGNFIREFFIAVGAVILVTVLLLPIRVASIAAMAIPITIAVTFTLLNLIGIELHEVSLASLIVVLGMVVDDAIVIADNYVEKLDSGETTWDAAWKSASELFVPVLTATLAIVTAFLPLLFFLEGSVGDFIYALPITVLIALLSSFAVAMLITPLLCHTFIKKGLKKDENQKKRFNLLDLIQKIYDKTISTAFNHPAMTVIFAVIVVAAGCLLLLDARQKFFPPAERAQFVIEINMARDTKLEVTDAAVKKIEALLSGDSQIKDFASFVGTSPPRVYYSFAPKFPRESYGLLLVNTVSVEAVNDIIRKYQRRADELVPGGRVNMMGFQQGIPVDAPLEVRITGYETEQLKEIARKITTLIKGTEGSKLVHTDCYDSYYVHLNIDDTIANKLGFTSGIIAGQVAAGFSGLPVSSMLEGEDSIDIILRLEKDARKDFDDLKNMEIVSPVTRRSIPIREVAGLQPTWQTGQIAHRNGVRTLTVRSFTHEGVLPSTVLKKIRPAIDALELPPGYRIEYGGEYEGKVSTFSQMAAALVVSVVLIYLILLFQFKNSREPFIVMLAIPLTLFGAILGLIITDNPFGFTAFVGLTSLVGIVIRNSIILVDYADELVLKEEMNPRDAAMHAGSRRLRPIFLTSMAAAVGVTPMIVSGSPLWAPLASVFSVGVIFSMVMTLIIIPVIYALLMGTAHEGR
ncbi:efflux RND transporter permease subunit [Desulfoluna sp.]|uniref:efflux RND transporter permease subunit n=1 Tax=Desulfoluna sp. TaxID=2045199 RepID=UPI002616ADC0|nr:efflux RND transporter permease subunit [Desulfoluna sp.]